MSAPVAWAAVCGAPGRLSYQTGINRAPARPRGLDGMYIAETAL
jgi:hypothetical protein